MSGPVSGPRSGSVASLLPVLTAERPAFARTVAAGTGTHLGVAATAGLGAALVADVIGGGADRLGLLTTLLAVAVLAHGAAYWLEMVWAHDLAFRVLARMRVAVFDGLERSAPAGVGRRRGGDLVGTAMHDVETLEWFYAHTAPTMVAALVAPAATLGVIVTLGGTLGVVTAVGLVAAAGVPWVARRTADRQGDLVRTRQAEVKGRCLETVQGLREVLGFGRLADQRAAILAADRRADVARRRYGLRAGVETAAAEAVVAGTAVGLLALGAARVRSGDLEATTLSVVTVLSLAAFAPVLELGTMVAKLGELGAAATRVREVADALAHVPEATGEQAVRSTSRSRHLHGRPVRLDLDDVSFRYQADRPPALDRVSVSVLPGSTLALVGRSGAGKSTLAHLLLRLWDPSAGRVLVDGTPLTELAQRDVPAVIGLVPQDVHLFAVSIRDNVHLAKPSASDAEVDDACRRALVSEYADALPDGLDTVLPERGASLSGGQRQRVGIARALLADPSVLVLDEASATLDAHSEALLGAALAEVRRGRTTVVIAHRLSTLRHADRVVVLDAGRVVQEGSLETLLTAPGPFRTLMGPQLQDVVDVP